MPYLPKLCLWKIKAGQLRTECCQVVLTARCQTSGNSTSASSAPRSVHNITRPTVCAAPRATQPWPHPQARHLLSLPRCSWCCRHRSLLRTPALAGPAKLSRVSHLPSAAASRRTPRPAQSSPPTACRRTRRLHLITTTTTRTAMMTEITPLPIRSPSIYISLARARSPPRLLPQPFSPCSPI